MAKNKAKMNKFLTGAITASLVATAVAPVASAAAFTDLDRVDESVKAEIDNAVELGFFNDGTKFNPSAKITRGQAALTLARYIAGDQSVKAYAEANDLEDKVTAFKDVPASYKNGADFQQELYYASLIVKDAEAFTQTNLNPAGDVTRSQMAKIITETFDLKKVEGYESTITDIDHLDAGTKTFIETIASHGVTNVDTFNPAGHVTRSQMASFLVRSYDVVNPSVDAPEITGVSAINATSAKVTFKNAVDELDFNNFEISGGLTVTKATLSADKKSAVVEVNEAFTRNQEYTLTATGFKNAEGEAYPDSSAKFTWAVEEGVTVSLTNGSLKVGEKSGLEVKDENGKDVNGATVVLTSSNTNIATVSGTTVPTAEVEAIAAGSVEITAEVTLADGVILTNTFKVTVAEAPSVVASQGFTLVDDIDDAPANTVAFNNLATKVTSLTAGDKVSVAMFETLNSDPKDAHLDFTGATVRSLNPVIATAEVNGTDLEVTANAGQSGKASFEVTLNDAKKTKKTFSVDVKKEATLTDISVDTTSVKLSDEEVNGAVVEGVNAKTVTVQLVDQYKDGFGTPTPFGKVTVSSNTDGIEILDAIGGSALVNNELTITDNIDGIGEDNFTIVAKEGKIVSGKVEVKYFKNASDAKPASTKTISVNVVDVKADATPVGLDIIAETEIDVNAPNTSTTADVDAIDFATADIYTTDSQGNRLEQVSATALMVGTDDYVEVDTNELKFQGNDELTLLTSSSTVNVDVTADGITKRLPIKYINSASVPASATVATSPVTVKLGASDTDLTFEELIFGAIDADQLILDEFEADGVTALDEFIAVKKAAKNGGYLYNKSLVTVKDAAGKVIPTGANLYGLNKGATSGNIWYDEEFAGLAATAQYSDVTFDVDFSLANVVKTAGGDITLAGATPALTDTIDAAAAGDSVSFTVVIKSIFVNGASAKDNNLLAAPVTINVTVTK